MITVRLLRPALVAAFLASVTACGTSPAPDVPADAAPASASAETGAGTGGAANSQPVAAGMPDVIGGNAGRVREQMGAEIDMTFKDASGQGRPVDDPAGWKICDSQPGPNQQITDYPVVFGVMKVSESCEDAGV